MLMLVLIPNDHGNTALHYACYWNYQDIAELLMANGAQLRVMNNFEKTPIDMARSSYQKVLEGT